jgi:transcriptional regulator with GAF, ATPase, and Fis domain
MFWYHSGVVPARFLEGSHGQVMETPSAFDQDPTAKRLEFEVLISDLSARFVNIPAGQVDREIEEALGKVRAFFDVDRCGLFEVSPDIGELRLTHLDMADGIQPVPLRINYLRLFPWGGDRLVRDQEVMELHTRDYPPEASIDRSSAEAIGVKTTLRIPLLYEGAVRHLIVINAVREEKVWPKEYIPRLRLVGEIFVNVLERKRADERLRQTLEEVQRLQSRLQVENVYLREQLRREDGHAHIVGESEGILKMLAQARRVAPTDSTVLITGETGTGKELLAQAIHDMSGRSGKTMVIVNCAALPPPLIESELFGREKGAFTGATTRQIGRIEVADGSTLFLDEIGDLPPELQVKLLRVLQDGRFERLGSNRTLTVNVRVITATHHDLGAMVRAGRFREDLFHRLNVYPIEVPPLRARVPDIPLLVWRFVQEFNRKMGKSVDSIPRQTMERLKQYPWSGNVRELRNLVERAMIGCDGRSLAVELPAGAWGPTQIPVTLEEVERKHICDVLERVHWRISGKQGAAEILGLRPTTLNSRMKKLGISRPKP